MSKKISLTLVKILCIIALDAMLYVSTVSSKMLIFGHRFDYANKVTIYSIIAVNVGFVAWIVWGWFSKRTR